MDVLKKHIDNINQAWAKPTMEKLIEFFYEAHFIFVEHDFVMDEFNLLKAPPNHYCFLIRCLTRNPDPTNDTYSYDCIIAIDLHQRSKELFIWLNLKPYKRGLKPWQKDSSINFKPKKKGTKYPDCMSIQDRIDFRQIERKMVNRGITNGERDFYNKYAPLVIEVNKKL